MIYLDSSVALAHVFNEPRRAPAEFWTQTIVSSRLLQYEIWNRLHVYGATGHRQGLARSILRRVGWIEMAPEILERALLPFPAKVRTLDGLHLATVDHMVRQRRDQATLASYDRRLLEAAGAMGFKTIEP